MLTNRTVVHTDNAPAAVGPYSQAVVANGLVFCSGQIPLDPKSGDLLSGPIEEQTKRVMQNLQAVLEKAGSGLAHVVRCTIYLTDLNDFGRVNEAYAAFFADDPPARACVEVAALPKGAHVEIDAIAAVGRS